MLEIIHKYIKKAQEPDNAQNKRLDELDKRIGTLEQGQLQHTQALARDLRRFEEIDEVSRLTLDGVRNLLDAQLSGNNREGMQKSRTDIVNYLLKGVTNQWIALALSFLTLSLPRVAAVLMLGGFIFYALGCIRLGYGAAVKPLVLDLIERAEQEIQGTKRGAERKAWVVKMLRAALSTSKYGRLISWAITDETIGAVIQFFFDRQRRRCKSSKEA